MLKFTADAIFDGYRLRHGGEVLCMNADGCVEGIMDSADAGEDVQSFRGILCPGFVNAHCHLELSHLKGKIPERKGLISFLLDVMGRRKAYGAEEITEAIVQAEEEMMDNGIVAVGDICNTPDTIKQKSGRRLYYHNFIETMGFTEDGAAKRLTASEALAELFHSKLRQGVSIVPHAPYSVSEALFRLIADHPDNRLLSIHNQEAAAENELYRYGTGAMLDLYDALKIDASFFHPSGRSSLETYLPYLGGDKKLILVHNTFSSEEDIRFALQYPAEAYWCLCPNANLYIEDRLPDIPLLRREGCRIVVGTDSLASNHQLSILEELKTIAGYFPEIPVEELFRWATSNGAAALDMEDSVGSLEKGKTPGVLVIGDLIDGRLSKNSSVMKLM